MVIDYVVFSEQADSLGFSNLMEHGLIIQTDYAIACFAQRPAEVKIDHVNEQLIPKAMDSHPGR